MTAGNPQTQITGGTKLSGLLVAKKMTKRSEIENKKSCLKKDRNPEAKTSN